MFLSGKEWCWYESAASYISSLCNYELQEWILWNITTETQEMEKRTLLWGSSSTRKWRNPRLLWKKRADLTLFEYSVSASGKHQSLFVLQFAVHLSTTARLFVTGNEIKRRSREKEIDIQIHCCGFVSSLLHTHILPLAGTYFCVCYFSFACIGFHNNMGTSLQFV